MAEKKTLNVAATYDEKSNKISIPVTGVEPGDYALRVFPEKSKQKILYKSSRLKTLEQTAAGFECDGIPEVQDCKYELKNVKSNLVVAGGQVNLAQSTSKISHEKVQADTAEDPKTKSKKGD